MDAGSVSTRTTATNAKPRGLLASMGCPADGTGGRRRRYMSEMIDKAALIRSLASLARLAKSDAQQALLGRVYYIITHFPEEDVVSRRKVKELIFSGLELDTDADKEYLCVLIDELED